MPPPATPPEDVLVLGAGAAGLMCAAVAGQRGRSVRVLERAERVGKKILVSGGGRCNFTNLHAGPENYLSEQPGFCRSALARYQPQAFVALVERHGIAYHEKKLGQLFCDGSSREIVNLLVAECAEAGVHLETGADVRRVERGADGGFVVNVGSRELRARTLVVAAGGLSWPKLGGSDLAHRLARQFGLRIVAPRPGLVPLTFAGETGQMCEELSGVSLPCRAETRGPAGRAFHESLLFTHRGLSGPAVLQVSSYLPPGAEVTFDLLPERGPAETGSSVGTRRARPLAGQRARRAFADAARRRPSVARWTRRAPCGSTRPKRWQRWNAPCGAGRCARAARKAIPRRKSRSAAWTRAT